MKIKIITLVAILSSSTLFGGFDDNAKGGDNGAPVSESENIPTQPKGDDASPQSQITTGNSGASNITNSIMNLKNIERNNKDTIKSGQSTIVNTATINLGRGTNASGAKLSIHNYRQNNRTNIKSRNGSTVVNTATINVR